MNPEIRLELKPIQEIAALSVQTEPAGASILLDGKPPQVPPNTFTHVPFGPHQLSATLDNYEPFKQDLQVRRGMNPEIHLELKPIQEIAALSVQTEPSGASILLDGKPPQVPPNTFTHVPFGPHQLSATLDNYEPFKQDLQVRRGMSPEIRLELKPIQEIAALSVQTEPAGASILLDGKPPQVPPSTFTHVPFGSHRLSATLDNYEPFEQDLQVRRGMSPEIRLELKQIQEIAALSVQTEPAGASILLDGKPPQAASKHLHSRSVWTTSAFGHSGRLRADQAGHSGSQGNESWDPFTTQTQPGNRHSFRSDRTGRCVNSVGRKAAAGTPKHIYSRFVWDASAFRRSRRV